MNRLFLLTSLLCPVAIADSVSFSGTCLTNPCTEQIRDQYGDPWAYVSYDISANSGRIYTSLGFINAYRYYHSEDAAPVGTSGAVRPTGLHNDLGSADCS